MTADRPNGPKSSLTRYSPEDWCLHKKGATLFYTLVNGNIVYGQIQGPGDLLEADLKQFADLARTVVESLAGTIDSYYMVLETEKAQLSPLTSAAYLTSLTGLFRQYPFRMFFLVPGHSFYRIVLNLTRPLLPFPALATDDLHQAVHLIEKQKAAETVHGPQSFAARLSDDPSAGPNPFFRQLLAYLENLSHCREKNGSSPLAKTGDQLASVLDIMDLVQNDFTELWQAQAATWQALLQSEEKQRSIIESIEDGYYECDLNGRVTLANAALSRIYGYSLEELKNMDYPEYMDEASAKNVLAAFNTVFRTGQPARNVELEIYRKDGQRRWMEVSATLIPDDTGQVAGFRGIVRDVTERRQMRSALQKSEERYRLLFEYADDAIFVVQDHLIKFPNRRGREFFGYSETEVANLRFIELIHPEDRDMVLHRYLRRLQGDYVDSPYTFRLCTKSGGIAWVQITAVRIEWEEKPAVLVFLRDITRSKNMEDQLRQTHKMEAIGTLAGGIAHDFNNILAAIMGYTEVVMAEMPEESRSFRNLGQIRQAVLRARDVIRQILTFSRPNNDERPQPVRLDLILKEVVALLQRTLPGNIQIIRNFERNFTRILARPAQLHEVAMNLCTNAVMAMENGGKLDISLKTVKLNSEFVSRYTEAEPGRYLRLQIKDTGCGIAPEIKEHIFEPYFTTKPHGKGTGMGLAVVHGIVTSNGGIITVDSQPGEGSAFCVFFPVIEEAALTSRRASGDKENFLPEGQETILFVDDKKQLCEIGKNLLERFGYSVVTATSAQQALDMFTSQPERFDLLITDLIMPKMNGEELARAVYQHNPQLPVIICTGHDEQILTVDARQSGIKEFIAKPYIVADFIQSVRRALDR